MSLTLTKKNKKENFFAPVSPQRKKIRQNHDRKVPNSSEFLQKVRRTPCLLERHREALRRHLRELDPFNLRGLIEAATSGGDGQRSRPQRRHRTVCRPGRCLPGPAALQMQQNRRRRRHDDRTPRWRRRSRWRRGFLVLFVLDDKRHRSGVSRNDSRAFFIHIVASGNDHSAGRTVLGIHLKNIARCVMRWIIVIRHRISGNFRPDVGTFRRWFFVVLVVVAVFGLLRVALDGRRWPLCSWDHWDGVFAWWPAAFSGATPGRRGTGRLGSPRWALFAQGFVQLEGPDEAGIEDVVLVFPGVAETAPACKRVRKKNFLKNTNKIYFRSNVD